MKIAVMIPTFRRPGLLRNVLESLRKQTVGDFQIVVSDNDAAGREGFDAALAWAAEVGFSDRVHVTVATERGLSQNRNNGLGKAFAELGADAVAMIDDDSEADPRWIERLRDACSTGADLIGGPTIYRFADQVPDEIRKTSLFGVPYNGSGFVSRLRSSNNCLIRRPIFERANGRLFNPAFGLTGGEDTHFFVTQRKLGMRTWWQPDAIVYEDVPLDRCTKAWIADRQTTTAINAARIDRLLGRPGTAWIRQPYLAARETFTGVSELMRGGASADENFRSAKGRIQGLFGRLNLHDTSKRA